MPPSHVFRRETIALGTNLLLLWIVGYTDPSLIRSHKRVDRFSEQDFRELSGLLERAERVVVTPHTLAETSNLLRSGAKHRRDDFTVTLRAFLASAIEVHMPAVDLAARPTFALLGVSDTALVALSHTCVVVTMDEWLTRSIQEDGGRVEYFRRATRLDRNIF